MSPFAVAGQLVLPSGANGGATQGAVIVQGGTIVEIRRGPGPYGCPTVVADLVAPGFIDLQVNGAFGVDLLSQPAGLPALAAELPKTGVTSFLATLPSPAEAEVTALLGTLRNAAPRAEAQAAPSAQNRPSAAVLGLHLEGPLLSTERVGAHERTAIVSSNAQSFEALARPAEVKLVTVAPEREGSLTLIPRLLASGVSVSLGHTSATFDELRAAIDAGATLVTHLFQAMSPFHHRAPGALGAALLDDRVNVSLIADGIHTHAAALDLAVRCKGTDGIILVTDAMAGAGMPAGVYHLGKKQVHVDAAQGRATLPDGTLAGSLLTMDRAVRNMVTWLGVSVAEAIHMASERPADALGLAMSGRLTPGASADLVLLDADLGVSGTLIGGRWAIAPPGMLDLFRWPS